MAKLERAIGVRENPVRATQLRQRRGERGLTCVGLVYQGAERLNAAIC